MQKICAYLWLICSFTAVFGQEKKPCVLAVYPTADSIPVNILRFYIEFSKPMQEMDVLKHVHLSTEEGKDITGVFFENQYELWNEDRTKVTLIVDPGRVKLGLLANNQMGRAFDEGKKYFLTVDSLLLDFQDQPLSGSFTKAFIAVKEDRTAPNTAQWEITLPKAHTRTPMRICFNDHIDHLSAQAFIKIIYQNKEVEGEIVGNERNYVFMPKKKWAKGAYELMVNSRLEDIAANSLGLVFDHKPADFKPSSHSIIKFLLP